MTGVFLGRFLVFGLIAWVVAIVLGVGSGFGLFRWRDRWPLAGAMAGLGTFCLYVSAYSMTVSFMGWAVGLFIGSGIAVSYGTLFLRRDAPRPRLAEGSVEELLWLRDSVDRLRPQRLDWLLTAALMTPGIGLIRLGLGYLFHAAPVVIGAFSLVGPLSAAVGLALSANEAGRLQRELDERSGIPPNVGQENVSGAPQEKVGGARGVARLSAPASPPSSSPPAPTRTG